MRSFFLAAVAALVCLAASPAGAVIAATNLGTNSVTGGGTTQNVTTLLTANINDTIAITCTSAADQNPSGVVDDAGNTYTSRAFIDNGPDKTRTFVAPVTATLASGLHITATYAGTPGVKICTAILVTGGATTSFDVGAANFTGSPGTAAGFTTVALAQANELILSTVYVDLGSADAYTPDATYTAINSISQSTDIQRMATKRVTNGPTAATFAATLGSPGTRDFTVSYIAFKEAAGAAATTCKALMLGVC